MFATKERNTYIAATPQDFNIFTYHAVLVFILYTQGVSHDLSKVSVQKVLPWAVRLSLNSYTCVNILGEDNILADLLVRWTKAATICHLISILSVPSATADTIQLPSEEFVILEQQSHASKYPIGFILSHQFRRETDGGLV